MAAPQQPTDIVSLDQIKQEFRIPANVSDMDAMLTAHVRAAVNWVGRRTSVPMIERTMEYRLEKFPGANCPIMLPFRYVTGVVSVKYWTPAADISRDENASIDPASLGRIDQYEYDDHSGAAVYWPEGGWPATSIAERSVLVQFTVGLDPVPDALRQACILMARDFFEGQRGTQAAVEALLEPYLVHHPEIMARQVR